MVKDFKETVIQKWIIPTGSNDSAEFRMEVKVAKLESRRGGGEIKLYMREFVTAKTPEGYSGPTKNGLSIKHENITEIIAALVEAEGVLAHGG
jgi:hypothetical protein